MALGTEQAACLPCDPDTLEGGWWAPWATARCCEWPRVGPLMAPWSPSHCHPPAECRTSGPPPPDGSVLPTDSSSCQGDLRGVIRATSSGQKNVECGRGEGGLVSSEGPWRARGQRGAQGSPHRRQGRGGPLHRTLDVRPLSEPGTGAPRHPGSPTPGRPHPAVSPPTWGPSTLQSLPSLAERPPT